MAKSSDHETISILGDTEAIKKLKHKYLRCLDCKLWDEIKECLTDDIEASFYGGKIKLKGIDSLVDFFTEFLTPTRISSHTGHHPEIEITDSSKAIGTWSVQTYMIDTQANVSLSGMSIFQEKYTKAGGRWRISFMACYRVYEEMWNRNDISSLKITQVMQYKSDNSP